MIKGQDFFPKITSLCWFPPDVEFKSIFFMCFSFILSSIILCTYRVLALPAVATPKKIRHGLARALLDIIMARMSYENFLFSIP